MYKVSESVLLMMYPVHVYYYNTMQFVNVTGLSVGQGLATAVDTLCSQVTNYIQITYNIHVLKNNCLLNSFYDIGCTMELHVHVEDHSISTENRQNLNADHVTFSNHLTQLNCDRTIWFIDEWSRACTFFS